MGNQDLIWASGRVPRRGLCVIKRVGKTDALQGFLEHAVHHRWRGDPGGFVDRRDDVDDVGELRPETAVIVDPRRPRNQHAVARTAKVRSDLLGPLHRRIHRMRPADRIMVIGPGAAQLVDHRE